MVLVGSFLRYRWDSYYRLPVLEYHSGFLLFIVLVAALVALLHVDLLCSSPCVLFIGVLTYFNMHTVVHYSAHSSVGIRLMVVVYSNDSYTDATPYMLVL